MNMRITAILIGVAIIIGGGAFFFFHNKAKAPGQEALVTSTDATPEYPWVEVVTPEVQGVFGGVGQSIVLKTGDELPPGTKLSTNAKGRAVIHFPDGSFATLDPSGALTIKDAAYNKDKQALTVRLILGVGTVWSKVLTFANADSSWNVETSHAVATVRGTAFGVSTDTKDTKVVGIENTVKVALKEEGTGTTPHETNVTPDTEMVMKGADIQAMTHGDILFKPTLMKAEEKQTASYRAFIETSKKFDTERDRMKKESTDDHDFREQFREKQKEQFKQSIEKQKVERKDILEQIHKKESDKVLETTQKDTEETKKDEQPVSQKEPIQKKKIVEQEQTEAHSSQETPSFVKIKVSTNSDLASVTERDTILFRATGTLSDGTERDVTNNVEWVVLGNIGSIEKPGVFRALLKDDMREAGDAPGAVGVRMKTERGVLEAGSSIFRVKTYVGDTSSDVGGQ